MGWSGVPGQPTDLDNSTACSRCGWRLFGHFFSHLSFLSSFSLSLRDGSIKTKTLSQRAVKPKTTNKQINRLYGLLNTGQPYTDNIIISTQSDIAVFVKRGPCYRFVNADNPLFNFGNYFFHSENTLFYRFLILSPKKRFCLT